MLKLSSFLIVILLLAGGCAPDIKHADLHVVKSDRWTDSTAVYAHIDSAWWQSFNDTMLDSIITLALQNNYNLKSAAAVLEAAQAQATIAGAELFPSVNAGADALRRKQSLVTFPEQIRRVITNPVSTYAVSANISWEIDLWGRVRSLRSAAGANTQASQAEFEGFKISLTAQTIKAWFAAIEAKKQYQLSVSNMESYQLSQERIFARYEKGIRPSLDYRLSRTALATAQYQMYQRQQISDVTLRQLELILGQYPAAKIRLSEQMPVQLTTIPEGIPADILNHRPDVIAAERKLAASDCNVYAAKAALFPRISLTGGLGTSTNDLKEIANPEYSIWNLGVNILQPVFQGGRLAANVTVSEARQKQAFAAYANVVLRAYAEIEAILTAEQLLLKQEEAMRMAANEAKASLELAEDRYYKGLTDIITLLDSRRQANNAFSQLFSIQRQRLENRVDFFVAMGGGFSPEHYL
jgi:NodT family efflux transporter outer membrane factor (OMF) lipoprotein